MCILCIYIYICIHIQTTRKGRKATKELLIMMQINNTLVNNSRDYYVDVIFNKLNFQHFYLLFMPPPTTLAAMSPILSTLNEAKISNFVFRLNIAAR